MEIKMKAGDALIHAAKKQAEGELAVHKANIEVYRTMPAGIGEHADITEAVIAELDKMAAAQDRLDMIEKYFSDKEKGYLSTVYMSNNFSNKESSNMFSVLEKTLLLKSVNLFKNIPGDILSKIAQIAEEVEIGFDEKLFEQGEHGDSLYIIINGKISVTQNERSITILGEGDCIGEMALLDQEPRSAGALAIVDSILLKIDQEGFFELMSTNPEIMKQIVMILTQRVREMNKKVTSSL